MISISIKRTCVLILLSLCAAGLHAQTTGQVMFVGFMADGNDGISFVALTDIPANTTIYFTDKEWNGGTIGGSGSFTTGEGYNSWSYNNILRAGTVVTIRNFAATPTATIGTANLIGTGMDIDVSNEVVYMYKGSSQTTPTVFLSAIANNGFGTNGTLTNTGLTEGVNAISITGNEDVMIYTGTLNCSSTLTDCMTLIATASNWATEDGTGSQHNNGLFPDFPADVSCNFYGDAFGTITYYSRNATSGGNWNDNNSWTTNSDGSGGPLATGVWPRRHDNVVILSGHTITVDAIDDNKTCGIAPDDIGGTNIGPFTSSNTDMFYHIGSISVYGTLTLTGGVDLMVGGSTIVYDGGTITSFSNIVNLGYLNAYPTSALNCGDDFILAGSSTTIIETSAATNDNLFISFKNATLCGNGIMELQNGGGSQITFVNGATVDQICTSFTVTCTGGGCVGFPVFGTGSVNGNTGPGGVGNQVTNKLWLRAHDLALSNGDRVTNWPDASGNGLAAVANSNPSLNINNQPGFLTNNVNSVLPSVNFDGGDYLTLGLEPSLDFIPQEDSWAFFCAYNVASGNTGTFFSKATSVQGSRQYQYTFDANTFTSFIGGDYDLGTVNTSNAWAIGSQNVTTTAKNSWSNGADNVSGGGVGASTLPTTDVLIGARRDNSNTDAGYLLTGRIAEIILYNETVNTAQRIIIENYLAAKYGISITNDVYTMDNPANGNFDFDVAGIGRATDGSIHSDARGSGHVRMISQGGLDNGEFLMWGHDNRAFTNNLTDVDGVTIVERLNRVWRVSETGGDAGNVVVSFDISGLGSTPVAADLRLLIDRDGDGFSDNDVTPIGGATISGGIVTFTGVNFQNGDRFTLGNTNLGAPLPVELVDFRAKPVDGTVEVSWVTASELNNSHFVVERSKEGKIWDVVTTVEGSGNSQVENRYMIYDKYPFTGDSYYRLKQVDFDGTYEYSKLVHVNLEHVLPEIVAYPNPGNGVFTIRSQRQIDPAGIRLFDAMLNPVPFTSGINNQEIQIRFEGQPAGLYLLQFFNGSSMSTVKIIKR